MKAAEAAVVALGTAASASCVIGRYLGLSPAGLPLVSFEGCPNGQEARTVCAEFAAPGGVAAGRELLLQFEGGDPRRPVAVGLMQSPVVAVRADDGAVLTLRAERRIELVCGKASIVLAADGKVVVKGANLVSRSSGPNKIRGATVDIN